MTKKTAKKKAGGRKPVKKTAGKAHKPDLSHVENTIIHIISEIAEVDKKKIKPDTDFAKKLNVDSMMALEILTAIEKTYKIEIPEESLPKMTSLREVMKLVKKLLK